MMLMITAAVSITNVTVFLIEGDVPLLFLFGIFFSFNLIACLWIMKVHIMKMIEDFPQLLLLRLLLLLQIQLLQYLFELSVLLTFFVIGCYASVNECPTPLFLTLNTRTSLAHDYLRQAGGTCTPPLFPSMEKKDRDNENPLSRWVSLRDLARRDARRDRETMVSSRKPGLARNSRLARYVRSTYDVSKISETLRSPSLRGPIHETTSRCARWLCHAYCN